MRKLVLIFLLTTFFSGCDKELCEEKCKGHVKYECLEVETSYTSKIVRVKNACDETTSTCMIVDYVPTCVIKSEECESSASICVNDSVSDCYEKDGQYYYYKSDYCGNSSKDECVYDPETKSAHCLSDEE
jgi:hypothetical protein